jgi:hypothetical protein
MTKKGETVEFLILKTIDGISQNQYYLIVLMDDSPP